MKNKLKNKRSFFRRRNVLITSLLTASVSITPAIVLSSQLVDSSKQITFNGKTFQNSQRLVDYVKKNSVQETNTVENNAKWEFTLNGKTFDFSSPEEMQERLSSYVKVENRITSLSDEELSAFVSSSSIGNISSNDFWNVTQMGSSTSSVSETPIYQAASDNIVQSEDDAYKSYYQERSAYYFNGLYFNSKEDLKNYLKNDYLLSNNKITEQKIILKAPNGVSSAPINLSDNKALSLIKSFISNNYETVVHYEGSNGEKLNLTQKNLSSQYNAIAFNDLDYLHVNTNEGKSRYIIDNNIEDSHDLIGPYFYNGNLDVGAFMNKSMWKKSTDVTNKVWQEGKVNSTIGAFFTSIINDDNSLNLKETENNTKSSLTIFRTLLAGSNQNISLDEEYLNHLKSASESVYNEVMTALQTLLKGKKSNTFYKIPVMYSFIMQRLINVQAKKEIINETINYFSKICDYVQAALETIVLDQSLLVNDKGVKFNLKDIFNIGNNEFNVNTNVEYFMNKIKEWPKLIAAMVVYVEALNNLSMMGGIIPFAGNDNTFLFDFSVISKEDYYHNEGTYEKIYNTYSQRNYTDFANKFVSYSDLSVVSPIKNKASSTFETELDSVDFFSGIRLGTFLKTVVAKNTLQYDISKNALVSEIEEYKKNKTVVDGGLLSQLDKALPDFISGTSSDQVDPYQAYIAVISDMRTHGNTLTAPHQISSTEALLKNMLYFGTSILTSAIMVKDVFNSLFSNVYSIYWNGTTIVNNDSLPTKIFRPIKNSLKNSYDKVKDSLLKLNNLIQKKGSYNVTSETFDPKLIAGQKFSWEKGADLFDKAAPLINSAFLLLQVGLFAYDLFSESKATVYYIYTTADGTQFIWDGGQLVSKYLGFVTKETSTIDDMKMLQPIQFTLGQIEEYYYYDGVKYFDKNDLKTVQMNYIFSKDYKNENKHFTKKYSFDSYAANSVNNLYDSLDDLTNAVLSNLGITLSADKSKIASYKLNSSSSYLVGSQYSFSTGLLTNFTGTVDVIAQNIIDNIRSTKIVKLPSTTNGIVDTNQTDTNVVIPGKVWTSSGITDNTEKASEYLVDNSANDVHSQIVDWTNVSNNNFVTPDQKQAEKKASNSIYNLFKSKFKLNSKNVSTLDLTNNLINSTNKFSKINSNSRMINVYSVTVPGKENEVMYFLDKGKAENYASLYTNATKVSNTQTYTSYIFEGKYFATENDIRTWVNSLIR